MVRFNKCIEIYTRNSHLQNPSTISSSREWDAKILMFIIVCAQHFSKDGFPSIELFLRNIVLLLRLRKCGVVLNLSNLTRKTEERSKLPHGDFIPTVFNPGRKITLFIYVTTNYRVSVHIESIKK
jgi:hypothetical protein